MESTLPRPIKENGSAKRLKVENHHPSDLDFIPTDVSLADSNFQRTDKETQTHFTKHELSAKIDTIILKKGS